MIVVNSMALRKASSDTAGGRAKAKSSSGVSSATSSTSVTSFFEIRASSAFSSRASRRFGCLISPARANKDSRSPYSLKSWAAVLTPMPRTPGTLSVESPASACTSTTLSGLDAEIGNDLFVPDASLRPVGLALRVARGRIVHRHAGLDELHQILVGRDDGHVGAALDRDARISGDQIIRLVTVLLHRKEAEGAHRLAHQRELRNEIRRRIGAIGFVRRIELLAEGILRFVEDDGEMSGLTPRPLPP